MNEPTNMPFNSWEEVLAAVDAGVRIAYHVPMNFSARRGLSYKRHGDVIRVTYTRGKPEGFWADRGHFDRFRRVEALLD